MLQPGSGALRRHSESLEGHVMVGLREWPQCPGSSLSIFSFTRLCTFLLTPLPPSNLFPCKPPAVFSVSEKLYIKNVFNV
jgi:hypothetical protein